MSLSEKAGRRLAGLWGAYDNHLIKEKHFLTDADLAEKFLEQYTDIWCKAKVLLDEDPDNVRLEEFYPPSPDGGHLARAQLDQELLRHVDEVRENVYDWARRKIVRITEESSVETIRAHLMFKKLYYGKGESLSFGMVNNLRSKFEIAKTLQRHRPWSIDHAIESAGGKKELFEQMTKIVARSNSPTEVRLFSEWWRLSERTDRPMLFPQVSGSSQGYFRLHDATTGKSFALHFDFGLVNVETQHKIIIECDSRRYHAVESAFQNDRDRQNITMELGWTVLRWTYEDVDQRLDEMFNTINKDLFYSHHL